MANEWTVANTRHAFSLPEIAQAAGDPEVLRSAERLVRFFYIALLYISVELFAHWSRSLKPFHEIVPFWPVAWAAHLPLQTTILIVRSLFLAGALAAVLFPERRAARFLAFAGLLEFVALYASAWFVSAGWNAIILVAFLLIFLPAGWGNLGRPEREKFLWVIWGCQAMLLLTYSMAGVGKLFGSLLQLRHGDITLFAPDAVARLMAQRMVTLGYDTTLGPLLVNWPLTGWPFLVAAILLQLFALVAVFRINLQRAIGIGLILFHIGSYLAMGIGFATNVLLIALFLLHSPFARGGGAPAAHVTTPPNHGRSFTPTA